MGKRILLFGAALIILGGCATGKYIAKPNEELYGTWTNDQMTTYREVVCRPDGWNFFYHVGDAAAAVECKWELTGKWKDSDGNIWYKSVSTITGGLEGDTGTVLTTLYRLSKSATVLEFVWSYPTNEEELKNPVYPTVIDPKRYAGSGMYNRAAE